MYKKLLVIILLIGTVSCKKIVHNQVTVYDNNFETNNLTNIDKGVISQFNGSNVLGLYNKGYFVLTLNNLPDHDLISISFDLYVHDTWDGNKTAPDGPDIWQMFIDGNTYINTTFSNTPCGPGEFCPPQSYPFDYPNSYSVPKATAFRTDLPGACTMINVPGWTTQYKIVKTITHSNKTLVLQCMDKLVQTNTKDPKCDESWSVDNIHIQAITL